MKAVLLSIKREWARKILSSEKTIEIRKTKPKLTPPFRVFMYETKADGGKGAVIGSFVCDWIRRLDYDSVGGGYWEGGHFHYFDSFDGCGQILQKSRLSRYELTFYTKGKMPYGWHVTKAQASPRIDLDVFSRPCPVETADCGFFRLYDRKNQTCTNPPIKRPP